MWFQLASLYLNPSPKQKKKHQLPEKSRQVNSFPEILASAISTKRRRIMLQGFFVGKAWGMTNRDESIWRERKA